MEYLETDTILYRNEDNEKLEKLQAERWDPVLRWACMEFALCIKPSYSVAEGAFTFCCYDFSQSIFLTNRSFKVTEVVF